MVSQFYFNILNFLINGRPLESLALSVLTVVLHTLYLAVAMALFYALFEDADLKEPFICFL